MGGVTAGLTGLVGLLISTIKTPIPTTWIVGGSIASGQFITWLSN
jgi:hypothetical protein